MTPGRGSRFRFGDFTLFVEVREEGWIASIRDHTLKAWHWHEAVGGEEEGRRLAIQTLLQHLPKECQAELQSVDITWETYGENAN